MEHWITEKRTDGQTVRQTGRQTEREMDRWIKSQTDKQIKTLKEGKGNGKADDESFLIKAKGQLWHEIKSPFFH